MTVLEKQVFAPAKHTTAENIQDALFDPAALLNSVAETSPSGILILRASGEILLWNKSAARMFGFSAEEAVGRDIHELILAPDHFQRLKGKFEAWKSSDKANKRFVRDLNVKDKNNRPFEIRLTYVPYQSKNQTFVFCSVHDITESKQNEAALRRSEECFHTVFHTYPDSCVITRLSDQLCVDISDRLVAISGFSREDLIGKRIDETNLWEKAEDSERAWALLTEYGEVNDMEAGFRLKNGTIRTGRFSARIIILESGPHALCIARDITEQKRAEARLRQSEECFHTVFQTYPDACAIVRISDRTCVDISDHFATLTGYTRDDLIGSKIDDINPWEKAQDLEYAWTLLFERGEVNQLETRFRMKDGSIRIGLLFARIIMLENGPHVFCIARDITDQKVADAELRQSEERFRLIFQTSPDAVSLSQIKDGVFVDVNDRLLELTGFKREEIVKNNSLDLHLWNDPLLRDQLVSNLKEKGVCHNFPAKFRSRAGELRSVLLSARILQLNNEPHILAFLRDITEHEQSLEALRQSEDRFHTIFRTSPDSFSISRLKDGVFIDVNEGFTRLTGFSREEVLGRTAFDLKLWENPGERMRIVKVLEEIGICHNVETRIRLRTGEIRTGLASACLLKQRNSDTLVVINIRDITEQKQVENNLRDSREQLRLLTQHIEATREEERKWVAREVHDELGQVLTAMSMNVAWMKNHLPDNQTAIAEKATELQDYIESAMDSIHRISARLRPVPLREMGFEAALEWIVEEFSARTGIICSSHYHLSENRLDQDRCTALFRILQEAMNNVARHAKATAIYIKLYQRHGRVILSVKDNGIGIQSSQVKTMKSFGLAGMRERAEFYGGHVVIGSHSGPGTTITAEIPLGDEAVL